MRVFIFSTLSQPLLLDKTLPILYSLKYFHEAVAQTIIPHTVCLDHDPDTCFFGSCP